jgi:hypothetical protein
MRTTAKASAKASGLPAARAVHLAKRVNHEVVFDGLTTIPSEGVEVPARL